VVVDASTDDTPARIKKVAEEEGLNLNFIHMGIPLDSLMRETRKPMFTILMLGSVAPDIGGW
jgi:hypothetical protein